MRLCLCCLLFLILLPPPLAARDSVLTAAEQNLHRAEKNVGILRSNEAWDEWRAAVAAMSLEIMRSEWPAALLQDLYLRGEAMMESQADESATGLRARRLWAEALTGIAKGVMTIAHRETDGFADDRRLLIRFWARAGQAWMRYLFAEEERGFLASVREKVFGAAPATVDRRLAWGQWWLCLRAFCQESPNVADRDIALVHAGEQMHKYVTRRPDDVYAWQAWVLLLGWQGMNSTDEVVRAAFFNDSAQKLRHMATLEGGAELLPEMRQRIRYVLKHCRGKAECARIDALAVEFGLKSTAD